MARRIVKTFCEVRLDPQRDLKVSAHLLGSQQQRPDLLSCPGRLQVVSRSSPGRLLEDEAVAECGSALGCG